MNTFIENPGYPWWPRITSKSLGSEVESNEWGCWFLEGGADSFWNESWSSWADFTQRLPGGLCSSLFSRWNCRALCQAWAVCMLGVYWGVADAILGTGEKEWDSSDIRGKWTNQLKINAGYSIPCCSHCQSPAILDRCTGGCWTWCDFGRGVCRYCGL